jgi:hypothetical protein
VTRPLASVTCAPAVRWRQWMATCRSRSPRWISTRLSPWHAPLMRYHRSRFAWLRWSPAARRHRSVTPARRVILGPQGGHHGTVAPHDRQ